MKFNTAVTFEWQQYILIYCALILYRHFFGQFRLSNNYTLLLWDKCQQWQQTVTANGYLIIYLVSYQTIARLQSPQALQLKMYLWLNRKISSSRKIINMQNSFSNIITKQSTVEITDTPINFSTWLSFVCRSYVYKPLIDSVLQCHGKMIYVIEVCGIAKYISTIFHSTLKFSNYVKYPPNIPWF